MALKFDGTEIPGEHGPIVRGAPEVRVRPVQVFQLAGEGQIVGKPAGRNLSVRVLLHKKYEGETPDKLLEMLATLDGKIGTNGTLEETGNVPQKFNYCTFMGWEPIPEQGQSEPGPLKDIAGTLDADNDGQPIYGWFQLILLHFRQLRTK